MAITREFRQTVVLRAKRDSNFRRAMLVEAINEFLSDNIDVAKSILRDYINATVQFEPLAKKLHKNSKSLQRMLSSKEFEAYLKCGRLEYGFLRVWCEDCHDERLVAFSCKCRGFCPSCGARRMVESAALLLDEVLSHQPMRQWVLSVPFPLRLLFAREPVIMGKVLGLVYRAIASHLIKKAGFKHKTAQIGAVTLIQRFGSALNLNIHFHMLFLDGVYVTAESQKERAVFRPVAAPTHQELTKLAHTISERIGRYLERQGLLVRDSENSYLSTENLEDDSLSELQGHSITYRIAAGPQAGRKVFTLQTLPKQSPAEHSSSKVASVAGFSLHAGVASKAHQRKKLERLCRYISRAAVSTKRIQMTAGGKVRYELKTPYRNGTTHVIFEPLDFIAKLAALVPKPRVNLTRFHGVFAPNSRYRSTVTSDRDKKEQPKAKQDTPRSEGERRSAMTWAQRLKRVFKIDIETCTTCGGAVKIIACIEESATIKQILNHLKKKTGKEEQVQLPENKAPPQMDLFD